MAYGTLNAGTITPGSGNTLAISEAVTVPTPTATTHAATKSYVDTAATQATTAAQGVGTGNTPQFASVIVPTFKAVYAGFVDLGTASSTITLTTGRFIVLAMSNNGGTSQYFFPTLATIQVSSSGVVTVLNSYDSSALVTYSAGASAYTLVVASSSVYYGILISIIQVGDV